MRHERDDQVHRVEEELAAKRHSERPLVKLLVGAGVVVGCLLRRRAHQVPFDVAVEILEINALVHPLVFVDNVLLLPHVTYLHLPTRASLGYVDM